MAAVWGDHGVMSTGRFCSLIWPECPPTAFQPCYICIVFVLGMKNLQSIWTASQNHGTILEDAVLRHQIFVSPKEFLVNRTGDIREQSFPIHRAKVNQCSSPRATFRPYGKSLWIDQFEFFDLTTKQKLFPLKSHYLWDLHIR